MSCHIKRRLTSLQVQYIKTGNNLIDIINLHNSNVPISHPNSVLSWMGLVGELTPCSQSRLKERMQ